jgi:hypothetical protein
MDERKLWLKAVEAFRQNINAIVPCPSCNDGYLQITDVPFSEIDASKGGERYLKCSNCERTEIVLYRNPPDNWMIKQNFDSPSDTLPS